MKRESGVPTQPPDIEAEIRFVSTADGGRMTACRSGYRPNHDFGVEGMLNDAMHEYVGKEWVHPGETVIVRLWFLVPDYQKARLHEGFEFTVQEGRKIVGFGRVTRVLNRDLEKTTT